MNRSKKTIEFENIEENFLVALLLDRIRYIEGNLSPLIDSVFECRKKMLMASLGLKWGTFRGWHNVPPYSRDDQIRTAAKDVITHMSTFNHELLEAEILSDVYIKINPNNIHFEKTSRSEVVENINLKWEELIEILKNLGYSFTKEECQERLSHIHSIWENSRGRF